MSRCVPSNTRYKATSSQRRDERYDPQPEVIEKWRFADRGQTWCLRTVHTSSSSLHHWIAPPWK
ncbi:hypothetical protein M405DRAFT_827198 [Rhizopogon salebrosus TDB-379]|nr:hypothetical protein M405DRAFT_827198 [Rhizopogon salebrosus TDB-379]